MTGIASGKLTASVKLGYSGAWQMQVAYAGSAGYLACGPATKTGRHGGPAVLRVRR